MSTPTLTAKAAGDFGAPAGAVPVLTARNVSIEYRVNPVVQAVRTCP